MIQLDSYFPKGLVQPPTRKNTMFWTKKHVKSDDDRGDTLNFKLNSLEGVGHKKPVDLRNTWGGIWTGDFCRRIRFVFIVGQFWMDEDSNGWSCMPIEAIWLYMIMYLVTYDCQHPRKGVGWIWRDGVWAPLIIHSATFGRCRYIYNMPMGLKQ